MQLINILLLLAGAHKVLGKFSSSSNNNVAVYWGQNSGNNEPKSNDPTFTTQNRLGTYCTSDAAKDVNIFIISFVIGFSDGKPQLNLANQCNAEKCTIDGTNVIKAPEVEEDIGTCRDAGKTVLLSIGGDVFTDPNWTEDSATAAANQIIAMYGPTTKTRRRGSTATATGAAAGATGVVRPFGDAVVDGIDIDFETPIAHADTFAKTLREKFGLLSAAPQCPFPDANMGTALTTVRFDFLNIQFYNNECAAARTGDKAAPAMRKWNDWAAGKDTTNPSPNTEIKLLLGVPGGSKHSQKDYAAPSALGTVLGEIGGLSNFGGVMIWDASQAWTNPADANFVKDVTSKLVGIASASGSPAASATGAPAASSSAAP
ncbi:glycoside hydrolase superfamily [Lophiotrema nucula]|uniref:chitinase n=1 Tax=Lophiotrema nucula TaxID=690887 RepID=A0A6A5ZDH9_9PLEO|nr:glycoside hydrolase superfamily [Lophiotrema nucula]